jgi:hypothetical protein
LPYTAITGATWSEQLQHYLPSFGPALAERHGFGHQLDVRVERVWQRTATGSPCLPISAKCIDSRACSATSTATTSCRKPVADMMPLPSLDPRQF